MKDEIKDSLWCSELFFIKNNSPILVRQHPSSREKTELIFPLLVGLIPGM